MASMNIQLRLLADTIRSKTVAAMNDYYSKESVKIVRLNRPSDARYHVGIHLHVPTQWELDAAVQHAVKEGFEFIFVTV